MTTTLTTRQPHRSVPLPRRATHPGRAERPDGGLSVILMPVTGHPDSLADNEALHELAERGLRHYTAQTANAVGAGSEAVWCEWADAPSAYIALDRRLTEHPDRDTALIWAAEYGWAVAVETGCGEDLLITASLGGDVLPAPDTVAAWVRAVLAGRHTNPRGCACAVSATLAHRLAGWAGHEPPVNDRTG